MLITKRRYKRWSNYGVYAFIKSPRYAPQRDTLSRVMMCEALKTMIAQPAKAR